MNDTLQERNKKLVLEAFLCSAALFLPISELPVYLVRGNVKPVA